MKEVGRPPKANLLPPEVGWWDSVYRDWRTGMEREKANVGEVGNSYVGHGHLDNVLGIDGRTVRSGVEPLRLTEVSLDIRQIRQADYVSVNGSWASFGSWIDNTCMSIRRDGRAV